MHVKPYSPFYEDPQQLKMKIHEAIKYYEMPNYFSVDMFEQWINETGTPLNFITRVFHEAHLESELEAEKLLDILTRLWNITPRRELGGLSPMQKLNFEGHNQKE